MDPEQALEQVHEQTKITELSQEKFELLVELCENVLNNLTAGNVLDSPWRLPEIAEFLQLTEQLDSLAKENGLKLTSDHRQTLAQKKDVLFDQLESADATPQYLLPLTQFVLQHTSYHSDSAVALRLLARLKPHVHPHYKLALLNGLAFASLSDVKAHGEEYGELTESLESATQSVAELCNRTAESLKNPSSIYEQIASVNSALNTLDIAGELVEIEQSQLAFISGTQLLANNEKVLIEIHELLRTIVLDITPKPSEDAEAVAELLSLKATCAQHLAQDKVHSAHWQETLDWWDEVYELAVEAYDVTAKKTTATEVKKKQLRALAEKMLIYLQNFQIPEYETLKRLIAEQYPRTQQIYDFLWDEIDNRERTLLSTPP